MLNDEEMKAIENLKIEYEKLMKEDNILFPLYKNDAKRLLNLIEKQSKEIERLNKKFEKIYNEIDNKNSQLVKALNYKLFIEDKIKAKIEELHDDIKYSANPLSIDNSKFGIKVLQSLLEKE